MDLRRLVLGLTAVALLAGLLLASFAPGGWFNKGEIEKAAVKTPVGSLEITTEQSKTSAWPTVGYVLLGLGAIGVVTFLSMGSASRRL
ncbi:MAG TPA: hypothetical protein VNL14_14525 [Candidatus Acidoferrales bacterium]|nr:hypothetical protein [Candidatus Acidoferrales bacterium]